MTRDQIAAELMRLHTYLRASADVATKLAIRRHIDGLVREAMRLSERGVPEAAETAETAAPDQCRVR